MANVKAERGQTPHHPRLWIFAGDFRNGAKSPICLALLHGAQTAVAYGDVGRSKAGNSGDGTGDDRAGRVHALDKNVAQKGAFALCPGAKTHKDGRAHILHADVGDHHAVDAASIHGLNVDAADDAIHHGAVIVAEEDGVREDDVLEGAKGRGAHLESIAGARHHAVGDGDIF